YRPCPSPRPHPRKTPSGIPPHLRRPPPHQKRTRRRRHESRFLFRLRQRGPQRFHLSRQIGQRARFVYQLWTYSRPLKTNAPPNYAWRHSHFQPFLFCFMKNKLAQLASIFVLAAALFIVLLAF